MTDQPTPLNPQDIANAFVNARAEDHALEGFPGGKLPEDLSAAYQCQKLAIAAWRDTIGGWKVGQIPPDLREPLQCDRLLGPIFEKSIVHGDNHTVAICRKGFAAVEAEFIAQIKTDSPPNKSTWTLAEACDAVKSLHIGIEIASCPLKTVNDLGPTAVIPAFGNNFGLIVGEEINDWAARSLESLTSMATIEGDKVGEGGAFQLTGGILRSVQFALEQAAQLGHPIKAGQYIATGQTNGIHDILPGQKTTVRFGANGVDGALSCTIVS